MAPVLLARPFQTVWFVHKQLLMVNAPLAMLVIGELPVLIVWELVLAQMLLVNNLTVVTVYVLVVYLGTIFRPPLAYHVPPKLLVVMQPLVLPQPRTLFVRVAKGVII